MRIREFLRRTSARSSGFRTLCHLLGIVTAGCWTMGAVSSLAQPIQVTDIGVPTGFQDTSLGHHNRGRATVAADFDLDGRVDFYIGNPGDESFILRNTEGPGGAPVFVLQQVLLTGEFAWGAAAGDYDNDGDYDLFVSIGGNEALGSDHLFRNMWVESGGTTLSFTDVTQTAGVAGPVPSGQSTPLRTASANAVWGDVDRDGDIDLFVSTNIMPKTPPALSGQNILWLNQGDGTFIDATQNVGLDVSRRRTRHSTWIDFDNDGDLDLYESNYQDLNVLWRNMLVESGSLSFIDVTAQLSAPGEDLGYPWNAFASVSVDFNNDGWQDLLVMMRDDSPETGSPYGVGHAIFLNQDGRGFVNVGNASGLNANFMHQQGVMGCQIGDINSDGIEDIYIGNGDVVSSNSPNGGQFDQLFISDPGSGAVPHFTDRSSLIDFAAPHDPAFTGSYPPYPYRTHGVAMVDVDGDGQLDIAVANGGPAKQPDTVREPNRLFKVDITPRPRFLKVRPVGNGQNVSLDAIGTRIAVTVSQGGGAPRTIHKHLAAGSLFSGQNGFDVYFGLGYADKIHSVTLEFPDGTVKTLTQGLALDETLVVPEGSPAGDVPTSLTVWKNGSDLELIWAASCSAGDTDYAVYEGSLDALAAGHIPVACTTGGATSWNLSPATGNTYYLVVPRTSGSEGSYGPLRDGSERPQGFPACAPQVTGACY